MPDNPLKKPVKKQYLVGAGVVTGAVLWLWYRHRAAAQSANSIGAVTTIPNTMPGGADNSSTTVGNTGGGGATIPGAPADLQDWMAKVQLWANSLGFDAATTQNALQAYALGSCVPTAGYAILNQALGLFGMPPQAPYQGLIQCQPFLPPGEPPPPTPTPTPTGGGGTPSGFTVLSRLINVHTGEHFWTESAQEISTLVNSGNWRVEGPAADLATAASASAAPLIRLINQANGQHFWTADPTEAQHLVNTGQWTKEGTAGYIDTVQGQGETPLLRLINPTTGEHFWTTSNNEVQSLAAGGWKVEGVAGYVQAA